MSRTHSPDKWMIVKFTSPKNGDVYKVMGGWSGGYLDSDAWRLSSGLEKIEEDGDYYLMKNYSGSIYKCHKKGSGFTGLSGSVYSNFEKEIKEKGLGEVSVVTVEEFNKLEKK